MIQTHFITSVYKISIDLKATFWKGKEEEKEEKKENN